MIDTAQAFFFSNYQSKKREKNIEIKVILQLIESLDNSTKYLRPKFNQQRRKKSCLLLKEREKKIPNKLTHQICTSNFLNKLPAKVFTVSMHVFSSFHGFLLSNL